MDPKSRRGSLDGSRKRDFPDRVLLFLIRVWRAPPFEGLGFLFGIGSTTAQSWFTEMRDLFHEAMVPRLVYPRPPDELRKMIPQKVLDDFPDLLAILDATSWPQKKPENFLLNRLSYSAYKHFVAFQALLSMIAIA